MQFLYCGVDFAAAFVYPGDICDAGGRQVWIVPQRFPALPGTLGGSGAGGGYSQVGQEAASFSWAWFSRAGAVRIVLRAVRRSFRD